MKKLKIFGLLSSIKTIELKRFRKYIQSDSLYTSRNYSPLADHILKYYPDFNSNELTLESMYHSLYPEKKFNSRVIISRLSELNRMAENFLLSRKLEHDNFIRSRLLAEALLERKTYDSFDLIINKMIREKENVSAICEGHLYELDQLLMIKGHSNMIREIYSETALFLKEHIEIFIIYFLSRLFSMYGYIKNLEEFQVPGDSLNYLQTYMEKIDFEQITMLVKGNKLSDYMEVILLAHRLNLAKNDDELFYKCKNEFYSKISSFDIPAKFTVFNYLYTYCIHRINQRKSEFTGEIYALLKDIIKHRSYSLNKTEYMPSMLFREVVITGLKLEDIKGVDMFIKNYSSSLPPAYRNTVMNFCKGKMKLKEMKFGQAVKCYKECGNDMLIIAIDIKMDMLVCFYEMGHFEDAAVMLQKNYQYLNTVTAFPDVHRNNFSQFLNNFEKLLNLKNNFDKDKAAVLINELEKIDILNYKKWMLKKLEGMMTGRTI